MDDALADVQWLQRDGGEVGIQLRGSQSSTHGVHNVQVGAGLMSQLTILLVPFAGYMVVPKPGTDCLQTSFLLVDICSTALRA